MGFICWCCCFSTEGHPRYCDGYWRLCIVTTFLLLSFKAEAWNDTAGNESQAGFCICIIIFFLGEEKPSQSPEAMNPQSLPLKEEGNVGCAMGAAVRMSASALREGKDTLMRCLTS